VAAEEYTNFFIKTVNEIKLLFNSPNVMQAIQKLMQENDSCKKEIDKWKEEKVQLFIAEMEKEIKDSNIHILCKQLSMSPEILKQAAYSLRNSKELFAVVFGADVEEKANIVVALSDKL